MLFFFIRLILHKERELSTFLEGISVIICAKDECDNLKNNLPLFLEQDYPNYEVILVDDQSIDGTKYLLQDFEARYSNLKVVTIDSHINSRIGKKIPLSIGIKTAKFSYVLLSDADCSPVSKDWIKRMSENFSIRDIVLGISPYKKKKGWLNKIIRYDQFQVALQYLSFALAGIPYMGVGRNLGYKRSLFFKVKGFASHIHIPSGDDDLFINEVATKDNVAIQINDSADILSEPKAKFSEWVYQKRRHLSTSSFYKIKHKLLLFLWPSSVLLFWVLSIVLLIFHESIDVILIFFLLRIFLYYFIYYHSMKRLRVYDMYLFYPIIEFLHVLLQVFFVLLIPVSISNRWK